MNWQSIETAPKDGTEVLLSNGAVFAGGYCEVRIEPDWKYLGYDEGDRHPDGGLKIGDRFCERIPNPDAGKRVEAWVIIGCTAFSKHEEVCDDDGIPKYFEPTHWMPAFSLPALLG